MEKNYLRSIYWRLTGIVMAATLVALASISYFSHQAFERALTPEVASKAASVGASMRSLIFKALGYGINYRALYGVEQSFAEIKGENPDFSFMAATDETGRLLFRSGEVPAAAQRHFADAELLAALAGPGADTRTALVGGQYVVSLPIAPQGASLGLLHIGLDETFVRKVMLEMLLDVLVVLVVALFFTLELLNFIAGAKLSAGLTALAGAFDRVRRGDFARRAAVAVSDEIGRVLQALDATVVRLNQRYERLGETARAALSERFRFGEVTTSHAERDSLARIRAPLFTFILAEEMTRPFLPSYVNLLLMPVPGLSPQIVIGLPIILFMLIVAVGQPFLGAWSERVGRRRAMMVGAAIGTVGFAATALAHNLYDLLAWRSLCALGYAVVFVAAQGYVLDHARPENRAQGFALFVGAIMVATICGPSIGGIFADNIGYRASFGISALLCALSMLAIRMLPKGDSNATGRRPERAPTAADFGRLLVNRRFLTLTALAAMPAKILLTGVCFYLVPLYIVAIGSTQAMAGRMIMAYAVVMVLVVPVAARFSDLGARREQLVAAGLAISAVGGLLPMFWSDPLAIFGVVLLLGLGQALSIASQSALVGDLCREEVKLYGDGPVYGVYRLLERLGNALGPLIAALLVIRFGYQGAFIAIACIVLACAVLFWLSVGLGRGVAPAGAA